MPIETVHSLRMKTLEKGVTHAISLIDDNHETSTVLSHAVRGILAKALADSEVLSKSFRPDKRIVTDDDGRIIGAQG